MLVLHISIVIPFAQLHPGSPRQQPHPSTSPLVPPSPLTACGWVLQTLPSPGTSMGPSSRSPETHDFRPGPMALSLSPIHQRVILESICAMSALRLSLWLHKYQWLLEVSALQIYQFWILVIQNENDHQLWWSHSIDLTPLLSESLSYCYSYTTVSLSNYSHRAPSNHSFPLEHGPGPRDHCLPQLCAKWFPPALDNLVQNEHLWWKIPTA